MSTKRVDLHVDTRADHLVVTWTAGAVTGSARFDRVPATIPEWLGAEEDLLAGADRRSASAILDELAAWANDTGTDVGLWRSDGSVERLLQT